LIVTFNGNAHAQEDQGVDKNKNPVYVSVIVPAYSSASTIEDCLNSLDLQDYPRDRFEVIVIDSGGDGTPEICKNHQVRYRHSPNRMSAGMARNLGAETAKGEILAFLDADCIAPTQWLSHLVKDFEDFPEAFGVLGVYSGAASGLDKVRGGELMSGDGSLGYYKGFIEGNAAFRRRVFEAGGRFGDMTYGECVGLSKELAQRGMPTVWDRTLKVCHKGHLTYRKMFAMDRTYARLSLAEERGALTKGVVKLAFLAVVLFALPLWPLMAMSLLSLLIITCSAYSLMDNMVSLRNRFRYLLVLVAMRLSRLIASALEAWLYLLWKEGEVR